MTWVLLTYSVPRHPSANRVYVWRKLKKLGAAAMQDAAWVLPETPATREHFRWLAAEIHEMGGQAMLWQATSLLAGQEQALVRQFASVVDAAYRSILADARRKNADKAALSRRYQQALSQDYFASKLGHQVRAALLKANKGKHS